ncbi:unnamed protein product [Rodentolepis nana]|uniref:Uncharacterized protein n=1 Tax=Rodentolepis nana TaxID=102285 RepID=A0A0R3TBC5_RODNA|nr:unnamed protein product [Rodentolepis nana]
MIADDVPESPKPQTSLSDVTEIQHEGGKTTPNSIMECSQNTTITSGGNGQKILKLIHPEKDKTDENSCFIPVNEVEFGMV